MLQWFRGRGLSLARSYPYTSKLSENAQTAQRAQSTYHDTHDARHTNGTQRTLSPIPLWPPLEARPWPLATVWLPAANGTGRILSNVLEWHRTVKFGMSILLSSLAPVNGEVSLVVSLVRSHSVMAVR